MSDREWLAGGLAALALLAAPAATGQDGAGDVVYVPTPQHVVEEMLRMAEVGPADTLIDLGSGDGRVVITAAKQHGARGFGVDLDRYLLKVANQTARKEGVADRARFLEQDLFETDLSPATVITTYLLPEMNLRLQPKFLALRPGTRIVAHDYDFDSNWTADARRVLDAPGKTVGEPGKSHIFLYIVPARLAGEWRSQPGDGRAAVAYEFSFNQEFQYVEGVARAGRQEAAIPEFKLTGDRFDFTVHLEVQGRSLEHRFAGRVMADAIEGTMTAGGGAAQRWTAQLVKAGKVSDGNGRPPRQYRHLKQ